MIIREIELRIISLPLKRTFETSFGRESVKRALIITIRENDLEGFGECVAMPTPYYSYETVNTAWYVISEFMVPRILGKDFKKPEDLIKALERIRGHNMAKSALECAFLDLFCKKAGIPLKDYLRGVRNKIESGVSIGIQPNIKSLLDLIDHYLDKGYRRIKVKIKPNWDVNIVREIRKEFGEIPLMVDANAAYSLADLEVFRLLDRYNLMMIEQPLGYDDLIDHSELQRLIKTPICLDESVKSVNDLKVAIKLRSCKVLNIKIGRVGGILNAIKMHDLCLKNRIPVWCGGMLETGIGRAFNVAIASLPNFKFPNDISASDRYFDEDIIEPPFMLNRDGTINVPTKPGIGVDIVKERLERATLKKAVFKLD